MNHDLWDEKWLWEWEVSDEFLKAAKVTHIMRFERYLEDEDAYDPIFG